MLAVIEELLQHDRVLLVPAGVMPASEYALLECTVLWEAHTPLARKAGASRQDLHQRASAYDAYRNERAREMDTILGRGPARKAIETFFRKIIADAHVREFSHGCMSTNQAVEMAPHDAEVRQRVESDFQLIEDAFTSTIERGQSEGSIASGRRARELARLLVVAFPGFQVMVRAGAGNARLGTALNLLLSNLDATNG